MTFAVQLNDKAGLGTIEVHNVASNGSLASELEAVETAAAEMMPEAFLGGRHFLAEFSSAPSSKVILLHDVAPPHPRPSPPRGERRKTGYFFSFFSFSFFSFS